MARKQRIRLTSTHVDRHGEQMSLGALETMMTQTNKKIIPSGSEHDPRIAPLGRVLSAELVALEDGEHALDGEIELFEGDYSNIEDTGDREIPVRTYSQDTFSLIADRNYRTDEDKETLKEIAGLLATSEPPEEEIKKSFAPISVLTIGGGFILGGIAGGFLKEMGADAYDALKTKLIKVFSKKKEGEKEKLFTFDTTITHEDKSVNVELIIPNPDVDDIQEFFDSGVSEMDNILPQHFNSEHGFKRIVFEYKAKSLQIKFGVLKNGVPIFPIKN